MMPAPASSGGGRKPKGQGMDRRREILAAARDIFLREGYDQTTIRRVSQVVGVSSTALYVYFKDKDDLISALCDEILAPLVEVARQIDSETASVQSFAELEALMRRFLEQFVRYGVANPMVYFRLFMDLKQIPWDHRAGMPVTKSGFDPCADPGAYNLFAFGSSLIARGQALGAFRAGDPVVLTEVCWAALHGLIAIRVSDPKAPFAPLDDHIHEMLEILVRGLSA